MICMYCKDDVSNSVRYLIRKAIKPAGFDNRFIVVGRCCEDCENAGKKTIYLYPYKE